MDFVAGIIEPGGLVVWCTGGAVFLRLMLVISRLPYLLLKIYRLFTLVIKHNTFILLVVRAIAGSACVSLIWQKKTR